MKKNLLVIIFFFALSYQSKAQDTLTVHNWAYGGGSAYYNNNVFVEGGGGCTANGQPTGPAIMVAILDSCTHHPWSNENTDHGHWNLFWDFPNPTDTFVCRMRPENYFIYSFSNPASFTNLYNWIHDSVPDADYVLIYSWTTYAWSNAPVQLNNLMTYLMCPAWPPNDSTPFAFIVKKGFPNILDTIVDGGSAPADSVFLTVVLYAPNCPVGVSEIANNNSTLLFPNPAHDYFTINHPGELKIYDVMGRMVFKDLTPDPSPFGEGRTVRLVCQPGIYFVKLRNGEKVLTRKLVVE